MATGSSPASSAASASSTLEFGTIFSIPVGGNSVSQVKFLQGEPGKYPIGKPLEINGKFYGVTHYGGPTNYQGAIFESDKTSGTYTTKGVFDSIIGNQPCSDLLLTSSGRLIGTTGCQCTDQPSALYEFDITKSTFSKLFDFTTSYNGDASGGALLEAANGNLYGAATYGGADFAGKIFEYDLANLTRRISSTSASDEADPLPDQQQARNGTSRIGLFGALNFPTAVPIRVTAVGKVNGETTLVGTHIVQTFPGAVTALSLRGRRPTN